MKQKPTRDIEVGDRITRTRHGRPEAILTVAAVLSRRGGLRRVRVDDGDEAALRILDDDEVKYETSDPWASVGYRRTDASDGDSIDKHRERSRLRDKFRTADFNSWPIEDVRRVLAAWPEEKK